MLPSDSHIDQPIGCPSIYDISYNLRIANPFTRTLVIYSYVLHDKMRQDKLPDIEYLPETLEPTQPATESASSTARQRVIVLEASLLVIMFIARQ